MPDYAHTLTLAEALTSAAQRLSPISSSPQLDAEVLLAQVLAQPRSHAHAWPDKPLTSAQQQRYFELIARRARGEPVAYLLGRREFWSLDLTVTPDTLIPRPDTELLVEQALRLISSTHPATVADIGTGSGAIALAIAGERPHWRLLASDISPAALAVARSNAARLRLHNVEFRLGNGCAPYADVKLDMVISNPPYVRADDPHLKEGDLPYEPHGALVAGPRGLEILETLAEQARRHLNPGGWLLLEHGYDQGPAVAALLTELGYHHVVTQLDMEQRDRATMAQWKTA